MGARCLVPRPSRVTRRARRRRIAWGLLFWTASAALFVTATLASYRIGRSQGEIELARLTGDLADQQRAAPADDARAWPRSSSRPRPRWRAMPSFSSSSAARSRASSCAAWRSWPPSACVPACRRRGWSSSSPRRRCEPVCEREIESRRIVVHTPSSTGAIASATFFDNRVIVTSEGIAARCRGWDAGQGLRHGAAGHLALPRDRRRGRHRRRSACRWRMRWRSRVRSSASPSGRASATRPSSRSAPSAASCRERQAQLARLRLVRAGSTRPAPGAGSARSGRGRCASSSQPAARIASPSTNGCGRVVRRDAIAKSA